MAKAVLRLAGDADERLRLGAAGRTHAEQEMDRSQMLQRWERELA